MCFGNRAERADLDFAKLLEYTVVEHEVLTTVLTCTYGFYNYVEVTIGRFVVRRDMPLVRLQ